MRSHTDIINDAGGVAAFARKIGAPYNRVRQWPTADSIPAPYWKATVEQSLATFDELAIAADRRRPESANDAPATASAA